VPASKLKPAIELLDSEPVFEPRLLALLIWAAEYYRHRGYGEGAFAAALPLALRTGASAEKFSGKLAAHRSGRKRMARLYRKRSRRLRAIASALAQRAPLDRSGDIGLAQC